MNFIKDRLNRDNFWNLMFWFGMTVGMYFVDLFSNFIPILALVFFVGSLSLVPYVLVKINGTQYKQDDKLFINKKDKVLNPLYLKYFGLILILNVPFSVLFFFLVDKNFLFIKDLMCVYTFIFLSIPTLYFILVNCPIFIIFNKNAWHEKIFGIDFNARHFHNNHSSIYTPTALNKSSSESLITSPACSWYSGNIYNSRYHK